MLTVIYLLVLTSLAPGDLLVGAVLGLAVALAVRPPASAASSDRPGGRWRAAPLMALQTARDMIVGTWDTARFCLGFAAAPGLVEIPRGTRDPEDVAIWGVLTGEAPDEVVVHVDDRDVLVTHVLDASDPDAVRARHRRNDERWRRSRGPH
jgi:multisubunit Na+/H+ antiporter MnhE subunit